MTIDEQIAFAILTERYGSLRAQMIWNLWDEDQHAEAAAVARELRPILEKCLDDMAAWLAGKEGA